VAIAMALLAPLQTHSYSVLAHQTVIDVAWEAHLKPLLREKYPQASEEQLNAAEAYAYGGSIIQDLGYYPYGSHFFSDLTHYVRSGDFVLALLRDSSDVEEYAFALGALAHYATDNAGHPMATNRAVPILYPGLGKKYGAEVTYEDDPLAHVKTEFGFDVLKVARGHYASEEYHDYVGFEVAQALLERAFQETYGLELKHVLLDEEKALNSYRRAVSKLIPKATRIAWSLKSKEIKAVEPNATHKRFLYNLSKADFEREWGKEYTRPSAGERFLAFLYKLIPKFGVLKILELRTPTPETERLFEGSFNASLDRYRDLIVEIRRNDLHLPNINFDVGSETAPGNYRLNDDAHGHLLDGLAKQGFQGVTTEIRAEILGYFGAPNAPYHGKKDAKAWARVQTELEQLRAFHAAEPVKEAEARISD
jgi:hypothetical protein